LVNERRKIIFKNYKSYTSSKTPPTTCFGKDVRKKEPSYTAGGNASWCNHSGKKFGGFLKI
jgi:hypothetical protein